MPVHKSAAKRARQAPKRQARNSARMNAVRTAVKKVEVALASGDMKAAAAAMPRAEAALARGSQKGALNRKAASRKISRLAKKVKAGAKK